ncbi:MAG: hypothetical protein [Bacteriophage sp.]|nr:MAG: hypothetical protein [Bacteriophage sp.]
MLCYLENKINECISSINNFTDAYKEYTDTQIAQLKATLESEIRSLEEYVNTQVADFKGYVDEKIATVESDYNEKITKLEVSINRKINDISTSLTELTRTVYRLNSETYAYINQQIDRLIDYIDKYACNNIQCYNPVTGQYDSICKILGDIYDSARYCGMTCDEFDGLALTCNSFERLSMTAHDFDLYAGCKLIPSSQLYMFSPLTGEYAFYQDVIYQLAELHTNAPITVNEFDALKSLTCNSFVGYNMTAYTFDNTAKDILM